jgi:AcrR family transcriptional regulator
MNTDADTSTGTGTAERIAQATRGLLVAEGAAAVSMRRVATIVGVTPMAIYRHYPDRDALLHHVAEAAFEELATRFRAVRAPDPERRLHAMVDALLDLALDAPNLYAFVFTDPRPEARLLPQEVPGSPTLSVAAEAVTAAVDSGTLRPLDVERFVLIAVGMLQGLVMLRFTGRIALPEDTFRALCHSGVDHLIDGVRA